MLSPGAHRALAVARDAALAGHDVLLGHEAHHQMAGTEILDLLEALDRLAVHAPLERARAAVVDHRVAVELSRAGSCRASRRTPSRSAGPGPASARSSPGTAGARTRSRAPRCRGRRRPRLHRPGSRDGTTRSRRRGRRGARARSTPTSPTRPSRRPPGRGFERARGEIHVLGVVEHLDAIVSARERHGGDAQPAVLHHDHGVGLLVHPHAALGGGELRRDPGARLAGVSTMDAKSAISNVCAGKRFLPE